MIFNCEQGSQLRTRAHRARPTGDGPCLVGARPHRVRLKVFLRKQSSLKKRFYLLLRKAMRVDSMNHSSMISQFWKSKNGLPRFGFNPRMTPPTFRGAKSNTIRHRGESADLLYSSMISQFWKSKNGLPRFGFNPRMTPRWTMSCWSSKPMAMSAPLVLMYSQSCWYTAERWEAEHER